MTESGNFWIYSLIINSQS